MDHRAENRQTATPGNSNLYVQMCYDIIDNNDDLANCESWGPLGPQDVKADGSIGVDIWMIDSSGERHLGRLEWIVSGEVNGQEEDSSLVWTIRGTHDGRLGKRQSSKYTKHKKTELVHLTSPTCQ